MDALKTTADALRLQSGRLMAAARRILDTAETEGRDLTDAETATLDQLCGDGENLLDTADEAGMAHQLSQSRGRRAAPNPIASSEPGVRGGLPTLTGLPVRAPVGATLEARAQWAAKYFGLGRARAPGADFQTLGSFLDAVAHSPHDPRLQRMQAAANEQSGAAGGFLVPSQMIARILGGVFIESSIVGRVSVVPMTSASISIAGFNRNNSQTAGAIGGISFSYTGEAASIVEKTPAIIELNLTAKKAAAWVPVSNELLSDSPFVSGQLSDAFTEAARARLELDVIAGTGAGVPLGIINCPGTIAQAAVGSQTADTIWYENIVAMAARLHPSYWAESVWLASVDTIPQLLNLQVKIKNVAGSENVGGSHYLVETDAAGQFRILGRPVLFSAACSALGDVGDIILCAPSQYVLGLRSAITIEASQHERFRTDETSFRATMRVDGQGTWGGALTVPGSATTIGWAVTLAAR